MTTSTDIGLAISKGKARGALAKAASAANFSLPALAAAVSEIVGRDIKESTLKMGAVRPNGDSRPVQRDIAEAVQKLTGLAASRANWPKLHD